MIGFAVKFQKFCSTCTLPWVTANVISHNVFHSIDVAHSVICEPLMSFVNYPAVSELQCVLHNMLVLGQYSKSERNKRLKKQLNLLGNISLSYALAISKACQILSLHHTHGNPVHHLSTSFSKPTVVYRTKQYQSTDVTIS